MFIQGDESQIATADLFLFCINFYSVLRIPFALWVITGTTFVLSKWGPVRREPLQQPGSCFRTAFYSKQKSAMPFLNAYPQLFIFTPLPLRLGQLRGNELLWWSWKLPPRQGWRQSRRCCGWVFAVYTHHFYSFHAAQERIFLYVTMCSDNRRGK